MPTITIPKTLTQQGDLVVIPRREYQKILQLLSKKIYSKLDKDLEEALIEARQGRTIGPFSSVKQLKNSLEK